MIRAPPTKTVLDTHEAILRRRILGRCWTPTQMAALPRNATHRWLSKNVPRNVRETALQKGSGSGSSEPVTIQIGVGGSPETAFPETVVSRDSPGQRHKAGCPETPGCPSKNVPQKRPRNGPPERVGKRVFRTGHDSDWSRWVSRDSLSRDSRVQRQSGAAAQSWVSRNTAVRGSGTKLGVQKHRRGGGCPPEQPGGGHARCWLNCWSSVAER
jgi:hypothetical protein